MGVWEYLNIVVSNSQCCCEFYLLGHTYSFWKIKWNFNDPCNQTGSLRHKTVLETGYKNGNKSVNLAQHCWFQLAEHDCEQWDVSDNSRRTSTMEIKKNKYKQIVEDMTICKWLPSQKIKNADLDILSHRKYRKGAECSSRWTSRWCGMSGNVPIWIFPPVFDTVTFWCCVFTVWSSVESVDGAGGGCRGRQREGAVHTPYMGTPPTLHRYWLRVLCSCLSTRWPSSSRRFDTDYFGIPENIP